MTPSPLVRAEGIRIAIIISVENYRHYSRLHYCHADARLLAATLRDMCDYRDNVHLFAFDAGTALSSHADFFGGIHRLIADYRDVRVESVLFYFAGHGLFFGEHRTSYLLLPDSNPDHIKDTGVSLPALGLLLRRFDATLFRVLDACHSGQYTRSDIAPFRVPDTCARDWVTLTACQENEVSYEDAALGHGLFTYYFVESIRASQPEQPLYLESIHADIVDRLKEQGQTPVLMAFLASRQPFARRLVAERRMVVSRRGEPVLIGADSLGVGHTHGSEFRVEVQPELGWQISAEPSMRVGRHRHSRITLSASQPRFDCTWQGAAITLEIDPIADLVISTPIARTVLTLSSAEE